MKKVINFFEKLNQIMLGICGIFMAVIAVLATINAILRFTIGSGFSFSDEFCTYIIAMMVFFALGYLEYTDNHLCIEVFDVLVKSKVANRIVDIIRGIITLVFYGMLIRYGITVTQNAYRRQMVTSVMQLPRYIIYAIVTASLIVAFASWIVILICKKGDIKKQC